jgi:hypothetical protein
MAESRFIDVVDAEADQLSAAVQTTAASVDDVGSKSESDRYDDLIAHLRGVLDVDVATPPVANRTATYR